VAETGRCAPATRAGRLAKARQFLLAAETIATVIDDQEIADAYVTLCVHAGIAAADVIRCARLGLYYSGEDHNAAVTLLASADSPASKHLKALLDINTRSGYSPALTSAADKKRAGRASAALLAIALAS